MLKPRYYWDACLFIAHLQDEVRADGEMKGLREVIAMADLGDATIVTSAICNTEVLSPRHAPILAEFKHLQPPKLGARQRLAAGTVSRGGA